MKRQTVMTDDRRLSQMAGVAVFFALVVIALGAFTRLLDAGLGCPDWPGCYGHLVPSAEGSSASFVAYKAWAEMIHRYAVAVLGFLMVGIVLRIVCLKPLRTLQNGMLAGGLVGLLVYQVLLGQQTVTLRLWPVVVTQHLLGGFLILSCLWLVFLNASRRVASQCSPVLFAAGLGAALLLLVQIVLGAWTSTNYASLSCPDFPFCLNDQTLHYQFAAAFHIHPAGQNFEGGVLPLPVRQTIQMMHRLGACVVAIVLLALSVTVVLREHSKATKPALLILALLPVQICLGIVNVLFQLPPGTAVCHTVIAALLLLAVITLVKRVCP